MLVYYTGGAKERLAKLKIGREQADAMPKAEKV